MADVQGKTLADRFSYTRASYWGGPWYSYWTLIATTIAFGFFGGDHFWLRSPTTGVAKFLVNILGLGIWWIYDILQILGEPERVQKHGLSIPIVGQAGIGAGMFVDSNTSEPSKKSPYRFLAYLLLVCLPFGFDFFIAGDSNGGIARFLTTILFFLWPIGFIWGCVNMFRAFFMPRTLFEDGTYRMFPINWVMQTNGPSKLGPKESTEKCSEPSGFGVLGGLLSSAVGIFFPGISPAVEGVALATRATAGAVKTAADTATAVLEAAKTPAVAATETASGLAQQVPAAIGAIPTLTSKVAGDLSKMATPEGLQQLAAQQGVKLPVQAGGGILSSASSGFEDMALLSVLVSVLGMGAYYGWKRLNTSPFSSQNPNDRRERNDTPPEPHGL